MFMLDSTVDLMSFSTTTTGHIQQASKHLPLYRHIQKLFALLDEALWKYFAKSTASLQL